MKIRVAFGVLALVWFAGVAQSSVRAEQTKSVWDGVFMAPSHSFDADTLRALRDLDFTSITDGFGFYPYDLHGLTAVPQLVAFKLRLILGTGKHAALTLTTQVRTYTEHRSRTTGINDLIDAFLAQPV